MSEFHLLRPEWLLAFIPLLLTLIFQRRQKALSGQWKNIIAPQLQQYLLKKTAVASRHNGVFISALWIAAVLAILALSGPSWQKQPSQVYSSQSGLIIALDLSLSMTSQDVSPSRLQRAKYKITDLLKQPHYDNIALIAYAGDAHVASPLTKDVKTILNMLPVLSPYIMPTPGSNLVSLVNEAIVLFEQGKSKPRKLLLITDGVEQQDIDAVSPLLKNAKIQLAILAVGTEQGAPIVKPDGHFFKDASGQVIMPALEWDNLQQLSQATNAKIAQLGSTDKDINYLIGNPLESNFEQQEKTVEFDQWLDSGYWIILPLLLLSLTVFRKGILLVTLVAIFNAPQPSWAESNLPEILLNNNQQAQKQFKKDPERAAQLFNDPQWKASSLYKAKDYQGALDIWQQYDDAQSQYNAANALAQLQKFDAAIEKYDDALLNNPDLADAHENKALVSALKKQQEKQEGKDGEKGEEGEKGEKGEDPQKSDQESQDGKKEDGENQQESSSDQESQDGENSESGDPTEQGEKKESQNPLAQEQTEEEKEKQQAAQAQKNEQGDDQQPKDPTAAQPEPTKTTQQLEKEQAMQQWIERIPDDPGGLLRNKFLYQYKNRNPENSNKNGDRKPW
jgi:Ca-activated chloride channel family protein